MIPISVCIITKNEAELLEKCLSALKPYPFEIVVTDTGSTDNSKEVALKYTDKVYDFEWINDFSAARNFCTGKASNDIVLFLDTDEFVTEIDLERLRQLIESNPEGIGSITRYDYFETEQGMHHQMCSSERIYNRKYYEFRNPIHEALYPISDVDRYFYDAPIKMDHVGYLGSADKLHEKAMRNLDLLFEEIKKKPDNPYNYFQIAQSYLLMRDHEHAIEYYVQALKLNPSPAEDYMRVMVWNYGNILIDLERIGEALPLLSYYEYYENNADYLCMVGLIYLHINQQLKALQEFIKALAAPTRDSIENKSISYYIGFVYEYFKQYDIAKQHYLKCGDFEPALEALERLK